MRTERVQRARHGDVRLDDAHRNGAGSGEVAQHRGRHLLRHRLHQLPRRALHHRTHAAGGACVSAAMLLLPPRANGAGAHSYTSA